MTTRGFLFMWWSAVVVFGMAERFLVEDMANLEWPFRMFTVIGLLWIGLIGNHMATGSFVLRNLKDWP